MDDSGAAARGAVSGSIEIHNWGRFQHRDVLRGDGAPPWIKNYTRQLSDDDYLNLTFHQRGILHGLRLEYARAGGHLPADTASLSRRLGHRVRQRDLDALVRAGFIEIRSASVGAPYNADSPPIEHRQLTDSPTIGQTESHNDAASSDVLASSLRAACAPRVEKTRGESTSLTPAQSIFARSRQLGMDTEQLKEIVQAVGVVGKTKDWTARDIEKLSAALDEHEAAA